MHLSVDGRLHSSAVFIQCFNDTFVTFFTEHGVEKDNGAVHFRININCSDGDKIEAFIVNSGELVCDDFAQYFRQSRGAGISVRGTTLGLTTTRPWALLRHVI